MPLVLTDTARTNDLCCGDTAIGAKIAQSLLPMQTNAAR
jgi:hypothetical protein